MKNNLPNINHDELKAIAPRLASLPKLTVEEVFVMPVNYFENLSSTIFQHPLISKSNPFTVPEGYFELLPERVCSHAFILKHNPFAVPENYFENLPLRISNAIHGSFAGVSEMQAPEGYFDTLPYRIQSKIQQTKKKESLVWFPVLPQYKLAPAAAMIVAIVSVSVYFNGFNRVDNSHLQANLTKKEIQHHVETEMVNSIDESILIDAIDEDAVASANVETPKNNEEISNYLIENNIDINALSDEL